MITKIILISICHLIKIQNKQKNNSVVRGTFKTHSSFLQVPLGVPVDLQDGRATLWPAPPTSARPTPTLAPGALCPPPCSHPSQKAPPSSGTPKSPWASRGANDGIRVRRISTSLWQLTCRWRQTGTEHPGQRLHTPTGTHGSAWPANKAQILVTKTVRSP